MRALLLTQDYKLKFNMLLALKLIGGLFNPIALLPLKNIYIKLSIVSGPATERMALKTLKPGLTLGLPLLGVFGWLKRTSYRYKLPINPSIPHGQAVPEPASVVVAGLGLLFLLSWRLGRTRLFVRMM